MGTISPVSRTVNVATPDLTSVSVYAKSDIMEVEISATELARNLSEILNRVRYAGERFVVVRSGEPVCSIGPAPRPEPRQTLRQLLASLPAVDDDFREDVQAAIVRQGVVEDSRWES